jgi:hypothetical protein
MVLGNILDENLENHKIIYISIRSKEAAFISRKSIEVNALFSVG